MRLERVEKLREDYEGKLVKIVSDRPELARLAGKSGRVKTINCNGRALVQFEGADRSWYDIALDDLKVVREQERVASAESGGESLTERQPGRPELPQPSPLEIARQQRREVAADKLSSQQDRQPKPSP